jgi:hypothetical protein
MRELHTMRKLLAAVAVVGLCGLTGTVLSAQRARAHAAPASSTSSVQFGPQLDFGTNSYNFGIGGRAEFDLKKALGAPMFGVASFDYFFGTAGVHIWEINANVFYNFKVESTSLQPYAGGGLNIAHVSVSCPAGFSCSATQAGLNLGGGTKFKTHGGGLTPFAEARIELRTGSAFVLTGGFLF